MAACPEVVTDTGLWASDPCKGSLCLPWYVTAWRQAAEREFTIAQRLTHLMNNEERGALANAQADLLQVGSAWNVFQIRPTVQALATIAKALRCLWFGAATRAHGNPPQTTPVQESASEATKKAAQKAWWTKWLPDLGEWSPSLSWPELPGFEVALKSIWDKLMSWFRAALPWVIGGLALWLFLPTIVRSARQATRR